MLRRFRDWTLAASALAVAGGLQAQTTATYTGATISIDGQPDIQSATPSYSGPLTAGGWTFNINFAITKYPQTITEGSNVSLAAQVSGSVILGSKTTNYWEAYASIQQNTEASSDGGCPNANSPAFDWKPPDNTFTVTQPSCVLDPGSGTSMILYIYYQDDDTFGSSRTFFARVHIDLHYEPGCRPRQQGQRVCARATRVARHWWLPALHLRLPRATPTL